jgi:hypothetical protein
MRQFKDLAVGDTFRFPIYGVSNAPSELFRKTSSRGYQQAGDTSTVEVRKHGNFIQVESSEETNTYLTVSSLKTPVLPAE